MKKEQLEDFDGDGVVGCADVWMYNVNNILVFIDWGNQRSKYIYLSMLAVWIAVGVVYGIVLIGWDTSASLYFSVGAVATAGVFPPPCKFNNFNYPIFYIFCN